ncbi:MAG: sensor histidine kinase [Acidimicrobiales bacterium]
MIAPAEIAARHTELTGESFAQLQRLMASWGALSDLSFSDLLLLVPVRDSTDGQLVVLGQIRPTTGATLIRVDLVGHFVDVGDWPGAEEALRTQKISQGTISIARVIPLPASTQPTPSDPGVSSVPTSQGLLGRYPTLTGEVPAIEEGGQLECLPIPWGDSVVAVVARVGPIAERRTGRLERVYRDLYRRLAAMVVTGEFPHAGDEVMSEDAPRVGDGLLVTDYEGRISYSSPNAMSALHRMGVSEGVEGHRLADLGVEEGAIEMALASGRPVIEEVERRPDVIVLVHCTPLLDKRKVTGSMVLLRDVTDLRRLDRLLLSKDAAIREVHHRVKNNLQTISSLLRLQARRLESGKGQEALREAERRVRSIAVVHEILSRDPGDQVPFGEIVEAVVRMTEDSVVSGRPIRITVSGDARDVQADVATPLAVVLAELLQNAVEHAFDEGGDDPERRDELIATESDAKGPIADAAALPAQDTATQTDGNGSASGSDVGAGTDVEGNVRLDVANDGHRLSLRVRDDGRGLPPEFDIDNTTSLGLSIVRDLVRSQLGGTISMERDNGTLVTIEVPLGHAAQHSY